MRLNFSFFKLLIACVDIYLLVQGYYILIFILLFYSK